MIRQGDETRRRGFWFRMLRKAEEALQPTKRVMNPWEIWLWPWIAASALTRGALETGRGSMEANDGDVALPRVSEPEWASPNHVTSEFDAMRVRDFSVARSKQRSTLIVARAFRLARRENCRSVVGSQPDRNVARQWMFPPLSRRVENRDRQDKAAHDRQLSL